MRVNEAANHWARPVFSTVWLERILAGHVPEDGLSERVVAAMHAQRLTPSHFASTEGDKAMQHSGHHTEDLQTAWCLELAANFLDISAPGHDLPWARCCADHLPNGAELNPSPCWEPASLVRSWPSSFSSQFLTSVCCLPSGPICPRWLTDSAVGFLLAISTLHNNREVDDQFYAPAMKYVVPWVCKPTGPQQGERWLDVECSREGSPNDRMYSMLWSLCFLRNASKLFLPRMATDGAARHHFFQARTHPRTVRVWPDVVARGI